MNFKKFFEAAPPGKDKIFIFDFDDTLVKTPGPEEGKEAYQGHTGKPWVVDDEETAKAHGFPKEFRRLGWWGRKETLTSPIFEPTPDKIRDEVVEALHKAKLDSSAYIVIMTGRHGKLEEEVKKILNHYGIHADEYFFKDQRDLVQMKNYPRGKGTLAYKLFVIIERLMNPNIKLIAMWDDRQEHIPEFVQFGKTLKQEWPNLETFIVNDVITGKTHVS